MHTQKICRVLTFASTYWQEIGEPEHPRVVELRVSIHACPHSTSQSPMQCIIGNEWVVVCWTERYHTRWMSNSCPALKHGDVFLVCFSISNCTVSGSRVMQWRTTAIRYKWSWYFVKRASHALYARLHIQLYFDNIIWVCWHAICFTCSYHIL